MSAASQHVTPRPPMQPQPISGALWRARWRAFDYRRPSCRVSALSRRRGPEARRRSDRCGEPHNALVSLQPMLWVQVTPRRRCSARSAPRAADKYDGTPDHLDYLGAHAQREPQPSRRNDRRRQWTGQEVKVAAGQGCDLSDVALNGFAVVEELIRPAFAVDRRPRTGRVELALGGLQRPSEPRYRVTSADRHSRASR